MLNAQCSRRLAFPCRTATNSRSSTGMSYSPLTPLDGRVATVTGGARGIGFESARALKDNGAKLVIVDINREQGEKAAQELEADYAYADRTKSKQVARIAQ